jgi:hypothetical protein
VAAARSHGGPLESAQARRRLAGVGDAQPHCTTGRGSGRRGIGGDLSYE